MMIGNTIKNPDGDDDILLNNRRPRIEVQKWQALLAHLRSVFFIFGFVNISCCVYIWGRDGYLKKREIYCYAKLSQSETKTFLRDKKLSKKKKEDENCCLNFNQVLLKNRTKYLQILENIFVAG